MKITFLKMILIIIVWKFIINVKFFNNKFYKYFKF